MRRPDYDVLLVSPPVGNFAQVHPAICLLTAYLRSVGLRVAQRDLAIECFHFYHSSDYLAALKDRLRRELEETWGGKLVDRDAAHDASRNLKLLLLADHTARTINHAKRELRNPDVLDSPARLATALGVLKDTGHVITAAHPGQRFNFQEFRVQGAFDDWASLADVTQRHDKNLLLSFVDSVDLPHANLLGLSVTYPDQLLPALCLARRWRRERPQARVVLGGSYVTSIAESFHSSPEWFDYCDYIVIGDGEDALQALASRQGATPDLAAVPNLHYRLGREVRVSGVTSRTNLARLPVPMLEFDGIDHSAYVAPYPVVALPISRGCYWGKCTFCNISNQAMDAYRVRPIASVVEDIRELRERIGTPYFDFCVDSYHPAGLQKLSQALLDAQLDVRWNAEVLLDPKFTLECLATMASSGCRHLRFGFESVNPETLRVMQKRHDLITVNRILEDCATLDIKVSLMSIIGFPTESEQDAWKTVEFYRRRSDVISFVTLHRFNVSAGSPIMHEPAVCNIDLIRLPGLVQPRHTYVNKNAHGMSKGRVAVAVKAMEVAIREKYPQHAEIHTVGIGGWLTFLACCRHDRAHFKQPFRLATTEELQRFVGALGAYVAVQLDASALEYISRGAPPARIAQGRSCVLLSADRNMVVVVPAPWEDELGEFFDGSPLSALPETVAGLLRSLGFVDSGADTASTHASELRLVHDYEEALSNRRD